ncbi:MAG: hypothetical protein PHY43_06170 [Verrucomicrobiales bacterium]|nr:hypothetical protein [Verrucomicrobiales bacterium]
MKPTIKPLAAVILGVGLFVGGCAKPLPPLKNPEVAAQLQSFVVEKEAQANAATNNLPPEFKAFFAAAQKGDWLAVSNQFEDFRKHAGQYEHSGKTDERLRGTAWEGVKEIWGALYSFNLSGEKYAAVFGNGIIESIPAGSIYFGGTDPGRFVITAMQKSQVKADPFFTLTQNALADSTYLDYVQSMYGGEIYTPTHDDSQKCFQDYMEDAQKRLQKNQLKPGEDVHKDSNGRVQISGQVAVMEINGLLTKVVFDKNPGREFYVEESFPLDWMYPHLEPHGLIMKLNRQPLPALSDEIVKTDHDYWVKQMTPMIGGWLDTGTPVGEVAAFAEKVYVKNDLAGFKGDPQFIQHSDAQKMFSKLRSSIAGLYAWRAQHAADDSEKKRMNDAADFAFRQAMALCPCSPETVYRYVNLLMSENRIADAIVVAETAGKMPAMQGKDGEQVRGLIQQLKQFRKAK